MPITLTVMKKLRRAAFNAEVEQALMASDAGFFQEQAL